MPDIVKSVLLPFKSSRYFNAVLLLEDLSSAEPTIRVLLPQELRPAQSEPIQLLNSHTYRYRLLHGTGLRLDTLYRAQGIVTSAALSWEEDDRGLLAVGRYPGLLLFGLYDMTGLLCATANVQIRLNRGDYLNDYDTMLEEIAQHCTELVFRVAAHLMTYFAPDPRQVTRSLHTRMAFLQALLGSQHFIGALEQIVANPHRLLRLSTEYRSIRQSFKPGPDTLRSIRRGTDRVPLPSQHKLFDTMKRAGIPTPTLPRHIRALRKYDTLDTPENRFVKHALQSFSSFLTGASTLLGNEPDIARRQLGREVGALANQIDEFLAKDFFREIGRLTILPLGSPVLQRRNGYRELLRVWLNFNAAARLQWDGVDDIYIAGQRNLDKLYEYWIFFLLLDVFNRLFGVTKPSLERLISSTKDGFDLQVKSGEQVIIDGTYGRGTKQPSVQLFYNRYFPAPVLSESVGSWSSPMQPDFTLSVLAEEKPSAKLRARHIHLDAKYSARLGGELHSELAIPALDADDDAAWLYKTRDILKMHAYRDAIHDTVGAYVLYPGNNEQIFYAKSNSMFPSVGAFPLAPGRAQANGQLDRLTVWIQQCVEWNGSGGL